MSQPSKPLPGASSWLEHRPLKVLHKRLEVLEKWSQTHPFFKVHEAVTRDTARIGGRELVNFSTYNYLGLSGDPRVSEAAKSAIDRYGTSVSASRITSGEKDLHLALEAEIASWLGTAAAIVMVSGHATNVTTIGHLFGRRDLVLYDALAHNSVMQGAVLGGARYRAYRHNDVDHLEALLREHRGDTERALIVTEGVFSMDGDIPDVPALVALKRRYDAFLMVDEAHSLGVLGATGRGVREHFGLAPDDVDLWMGTLSKSLASAGGYIAGSRELIRYLKYTVPGFVYSVGLTPPDTAAALAALRVLASEPERVRRLQHNARQFLEAARRAGLDTHLARGGAVVPVVTGSSFRAVKLSDALFRRGINVDPVISPAVEQDKARLRFFVSAAHSEEQLSTTVRALAEEIAHLPERLTLGGEILSTLPSRDRADLPFGRVTDPGRVYHKRAQLWDAASGEREARYDPVVEARNGQRLRAFFDGWRDAGVPDASALSFDADARVAVPAIAGAPMGGVWRGDAAFVQYLEHQRRVRPSTLTSVDYVLPHGKTVIVAGRRQAQQREEPYLFSFAFDGERLVRAEEIIAGDAWPGEGQPAAQTAPLIHDAAAARENVRLTHEMYATFVSKGDVEHFIARSSPDLIWEVPGPSQLPFTGRWHGVDGLLEFWRGLAIIMDLHEYWHDAVIARGHEVYIVGGFRSTAIPTAIAYSDPFVHVAGYRNGMLQSFREYFDPCITLAAYRPELLAG